MEAAGALALLTGLNQLLVVRLSLLSVYLVSRFYVFSVLSVYMVSRFYELVIILWCLKSRAFLMI